MVIIELGVFVALIVIAFVVVPIVMALAKGIPALVRLIKSQN